MNNRVINNYVEVVEDCSGEVVKRFGPMSFFKADKVETGMIINLNHELYSTRCIVSEEELPEV